MTDTTTNRTSATKSQSDTKMNKGTLRSGAASAAKPAAPKTKNTAKSDVAAATRKAAKPAPVAKGQTKAARVEALLSPKSGVSLEKISDATGWQAHTCRAFLSGLRKKGRNVIRASDKAGKSIYLIAMDDRATRDPAKAIAKADAP